MMPSQADRSTATRTAIIAAARTLFGSRGIALVTIDDVAALAGVTKGGIYHHFASKEALFADVVISEQARLAALVSPGRGDDLVNMLVGAIRDYLVAATAPVTRQILLIDGPAVLGWAKWRDIDHRMFGQSVMQAIVRIRGGDGGDPTLETLSKLVLGAVTEGAMLCLDAPDPGRSANEIAEALRLLLNGLKHQGDTGG